LFVIFVSKDKFLLPAGEASRAAPEAAEAAGGTFKGARFALQGVSQDPRRADRLQPGLFWEAHLPDSVGAAEC